MPSREQIQWAKFRVVVMSVVALLILSVLLYLLSGGRTFFEPKAELRTYLSDSAGLSVGSAVQLNGIPVGEIESIRFSGLKDPQKVVEVRMTIDRHFLSQIPEDSTTDITAENLLGDSLISIDQGQSPKRIRDHGVLSHQEEVTLLNRIDIPTFEAKLRTVDALLEQIQSGKSDLGQLVTTDTVYNDLVQKLGEMQQGMEAASRTESTFGRVVYSDDDYQEMLGTLRRVDGKLAELQSERSGAGKLLQNPAAYDSLRTKISDIRRSVERINQGNSTSVFTSDELYVSMNRKVASLIQAVDDFNAGRGPMGRILVNSQLYDSLNGKARELQSQLRDFRTDPKKYLRINLGIF